MVVPRAEVENWQNVGPALFVSGVARPQCIGSGVSSLQHRRAKSRQALPGTILLQALTATRRQLLSTFASNGRLISARVLAAG